MNTIIVPIWMIVLSTGASENIQVPGTFTSYEACAAALVAYAGRTDRVVGRCVQSGATAVPLPADIVQKLKEHEEAAQAKAPKK